ncbi:MAG TPA: hypothetical protein VGX68_20290 [Thermoanaerobaculia bacterium]|jgi:hypothetical protein|nr:hypothetical protein [Thermoanaerobaculia bacterium]
MSREGDIGSGAALRRVLAAATRVQEAQGESFDPQAYDEIFRRLSEGVREMQKRLARERKLAQAQWTVLERHPQQRRLMMIRNDRRLQTWGLYRVLLDRSRGLVLRQARAAADLAELALAVARCLDPEKHGEETTADFQAGALMALAEAKRHLSDSVGAWESFDAARRCLESGTGDPLERAELEVLRARLLHGFGREEDASQALRRARNLLRKIGDTRAERGELLGDGHRHDTEHRQARG